MYQLVQRAAAMLLAALTATACVADAPTVPTSRPDAGAVAPRAVKPPRAQLVPSLIVCNPLPSASDVRTIGPEGGELRIGPHRLTVPAGALQSPVVITGEAPPSTAVLVKFSPDGLRFAERATLTLSYSHCARLPSLRETIVQVDDLLAILEVLPSQDSPAGTVTTRLEHFSNYAVAW
jgi:hypothetical protein